MSSKKQQSFLQGAIILLIGTVLVKIIGALFKIPLTNLIGGDGMGYFGTAYNLFNPISSLAVAGLPVAVSKLISENASLGRYRDVKKIKVVSYAIFFITGTVGMFVMLFSARFFSNIFSNPGAFRAMLCIAPAVFFLCLMSAYRGYYVGLSNMYPTAISQIIEAFCKLVFGLALAYLAIYVGDRQIPTGVVFGIKGLDISQARAVVMSYSAAGAVLGVTIGTAFGFIYLVLYDKLKGVRVTDTMLISLPPEQKTSHIVRELVKIAVPVCLGTLVINLTSMIDLVSVMNRLNKAIMIDKDLVLSSLKISADFYNNTADFPNFLYGAYQCAVTMFLLIPTLTSSLGVSALPEISTAYAKRDSKRLSTSIASILKICTIIAVPAGLGMLVLAEPILNLLYMSKPIEAMVATPALRVLAVSAIFVAITAPINSILQGIGKATVPVYLMLIGAVVKIFTNYNLVAIPKINILGATFGTLFCYIFIVLMSIILLLKFTKIKLPFFEVFIKPCISGGICAAIAYFLYNPLKIIFSENLSLAITIILAGIFYIMALFVLGAIKKQDILLLPKGKKLAKTLEKYGLLS